MHATSAETVEQFARSIEHLAPEDRERTLKTLLYEYLHGVLTLTLKASRWSTPADKIAEFVKQVFIVVQQHGASFWSSSPAKLLCDIFWLLDVKLASAERFLADLVALFVRTQLLSAADCMINLDPDLLSRAHVIQSKDSFNKKIVRINTAILYKQQRYNLLREDSEAFSMITFLLKESPSSLFTDLMTLVGSFDLDANRVIDLIISEWISRPLGPSTLFLDTVKRFNCPHLVNIIDFKLSHLADDQQLKYSLIFVAALMVREDMLCLGTILEILKSDTLQLSWLTDHLMRLGLIDHAIAISKSFGISPLSLDTRCSYFSALALFIHPMYQEACGSKFEVVSIDTLQASYMYTYKQLLDYNSLDESDWKGSLISYIDEFSDCPDVLLVTKCLRIGVVESDQSLGFWLGFIVKYVWKLVNRDCLPHLTFLAWQIISKLPGNRRYFYYERLLGSLQMYDVDIKLSAKKLVKRLANETIVSVGRALAKLALRNPFVVSEVLLDSVAAYDNFITVVAEILKFWSPFSLDVLMYRAVKILRNRPANNLSLLLASICSRYPDVIDLESYVEMLMTLFIEDRSDSIECYSNLVSKMTGLEPLEEWSEEQIKVKAGPLSQFRHMFLNSKLFNPHEKSDNAHFAKLMDCLSRTGHVIPLLIALIQKTQMSYRVPVEDPETGEYHFLGSSKQMTIKEIGKLIDVARDALMQQVDYMRLTIGGSSDQGLLAFVDSFEHYGIPSPESFILGKLFSKSVDSEEKTSFWSLDLVDLINVSSVDMPGSQRQLVYDFILPRMKLSIIDALFCGKFVASLYASGKVTGAIFADFAKLPSIVLKYLSQNESVHLGYMLNVVLPSIQQPSGTESLDSESASEDSCAVSHVSLVITLFKDVVNILRATDALNSELDYIVRRNCMFFLIKMTNSFPYFVELGELMTFYFSTMAEIEVHNDLKLVMRRYLQMLKSSKMSWKSLADLFPHYMDDLKAFITSVTDEISAYIPVVNMDVDQAVISANFNDVNQKILEETEHEQRAILRESEKLAPNFQEKVEISRPEKRPRLDTHQVYISRHNARPTTVPSREPYHKNAPPLSNDGLGNARSRDRPDDRAPRRTDSRETRRDDYYRYYDRPREDRLREDYARDERPRDDRPHNSARRH